MVAEEKIAISYEVKGIGSFVKSTKDAEKALRSESKALEVSARELQKRVIELKKSEDSDKKLIRSLQLEAQAARLSAGALKSQASALNQEAAAAKKAAKATEEASSSSKLLNAVLTGGTIASVLAITAGLTSMANAALKVSDEYEVLQSRIKNATEATGDYVGVSNELNRISSITGTKLESNVTLFQRLSQASDALGASNQDILRFTESIGKLGTVSGTSPEALKDATMQLAQALGQTKFQAEETNSVLDGMPAVARRIEKALGLVPGGLKQAVKEGKVFSKDVLAGILSQSEDIDKEFNKFGKSLSKSQTTLQNSFDRLLNTLDTKLGASTGLAKVLNILADSFNGLTDSIIGTSVNLGKFLEKAGLGELNVSAAGGLAATAVLGPAGSLFNGLGIIANVKAKDLAKAGNGKGFVSDKRGPGITTVDEQELIKKEKALIKAIHEQLDLELRAIDTRYDKMIADQGPFPRQKDINTLNIQRTTDKGRYSQKVLRTLLATPLQSQEGKDERNTFKDNLKLDIQEIKNQYQVLNNEQEKLDITKQIADTKQLSEFRLASIDQIKDREIASGKEVSENLDQEYQNRTISIKAYYDQQTKLIDGQIEAERVAKDERIKILKARISEAEKINDEAAKRQAESDIDNAERVFEDAADNFRAQQDALSRDRKQALGQAARDFGDGLESAISTAIQEAFDGTGPLKALKNFANNLKNLVVGTLADAIAQGFRQSKIFAGISDFFGNLFNKLAGQGSGAPAPASPGLNISKGNAAMGAGGALLFAGGSMLASRSKGTLGGLAGVGLSAAGGALSGAALGSIVPVIGTAIGAVIGGLAGAAGGAAQGQGDTFLGRNKGKIIGTILGGVPGFFLGKSSDARAKRLRETAKNEAMVQEFVNNILGDADQNNITDLQSRQAALYAQWSKMERSGKTGKQGLLDAANQLQQAIAARQKSIAEAIKELKRQNEDLVDQIALNDAKPFETATLERQIALRQITADTQKLLDQFKDSQAARTEILKQESLKRKLLEQQEADAAKATVQNLQDLLSQRDEVANANVFQRAKSQEMLKKESLANIDQDIAKAYQTLIGQLNAGITPGQTAGLNQILAQARQLMPQNNNLSIVINGADNPDLIRQEITRAFNAFILKVNGANVA